MRLSRLMFLFLPVVLAAYAADAGMQTLAFYEVKPAAQAPVLDGRLSDPAWQGANRAKAYWEYYKSDPGPGALDTEFRMVYDARGVYLAVINRDPKVQEIRAVRVTRDDPQMWQDDCAEVYFDPAGLSVGYSRFVVNPLGTQQDSRRIDTAVSLPHWSGTGWQVQTATATDAWIIEAFFPWSDLGRKAEPGQLWRFCHVRYAYSTGKFQGVTWSPGGNYRTPERFGYLYFGSAGVLPLEQVGDLLSSSVTPPWSLPAGDRIAVCAKPGQTAIHGADALVETERSALDSAVDRTEQALARLNASKAGAALQGKLAEVRSERDALPVATGAVEATDAMRRIAALKRRADTTYWEARLQTFWENLP